MRFRTWLEQTEGPALLRKDQHLQVQKLYDAAVKALGINGAPTAAATTTLGDIQDDSGNPDRPPEKGVRLVQNKLQHVLDALSKIPHFEDRVADVQNWLQRLAAPSSSGTPRPNETVATLLKKMFGNDALSLYGEKKWKTQVSGVEPKEPQDQEQPPQDQTAQSMASQMADQMPAGPDRGGPQDMMGGTTPGGPDMGQMMPPMGGPDMGMMPPDMMGGQQMPPDPTQPLPGPGGPFPKPPMGGNMAF